MCQDMRLDSAVAVLGYKFSEDRVRLPPRQMLTAEDYMIAMEEILKRARNARTREHKLVLHNLVSARFFAFVCCKSLRSFTKSPGLSTAQSKKEFGSTVTGLTEAQLIDNYFKQLRHKLFCTSHHRTCLVRANSSGPDHEELDDIALGFWAKMIVGVELTII